MKSLMPVGVVGAVIVLARVLKLPLEGDCADDNSRVWQSRMARLRISVAQQRGEPEEQRPAWRSSRGAAKAAAARAVPFQCTLALSWSLSHLIDMLGIIPL